MHGHAFKFLIFKYDYAIVAVDVPMFQENSAAEMHMLDIISFKNSSRFGRLHFQNCSRKLIGA